jgi:HEAT repeat protein
MDAYKDGDVATLVDALRHTELRALAVRRLGELRARETIPKIVPLLNAPTSGLRGAAARALGRLQAQEAYEDLIETSRADPDPVVRSWALFAVGCIAPEAPDPRVVQLAADPDDMVRHTAIGALLASPDLEAREQGDRLRAREKWRQRRTVDRIVRRIEAERSREQA